MVILQELVQDNGKWLWQDKEELDFKSARQAKKNSVEINQNSRLRIRTE